MEGNGLPDQSGGDEQNAENSNGEPDGESEGDESATPARMMLTRHLPKRQFKWKFFLMGKVTFPEQWDMLAKLLDDFFKQ